MGVPAPNVGTTEGGGQGNLQVLPCRLPKVDVGRWIRVSLTIRWDIIVSYALQSGNSTSVGNQQEWDCDNDTREIRGRLEVS